MYMRGWFGFDSDTSEKKQRVGMDTALMDSTKINADENDAPLLTDADFDEIEAFANGQVLATA